MKTLALLVSSSLSSSAPPLLTSTLLQAGPPWRTLAQLAALVLLVHALVLGTSPRHVGPTPAPAPRQVPAMITRSMAPPPMQPSARATVAPPAVKPPPARPVHKPRPRRPQTAPAQASPLPAMAAPKAESAAPAPDTPDTPATGTDTASPDGNGLPAVSPSTALTPEVPPVTPTDAAQAALVAASVPAAPPADPSQTPVAVTLPASVQLGYKMSGSAKGLPYQATGQLVWHRNGAHYEARMTVSALFLGSRSMTSQGQVSPEGLAPSRFTDKSRTEVAAHFEPDKGQISFSANTPSVPWVKSGQDRVSVFLQLGGMLAAQPAGFPDGSSISIYTVGPRGAESWTFRVEGAQLLRVPFGELATLKLSRQLRQEYDQKLEIWFAPSLGYLPVRNKITQANGDFVDQLLSVVSRP